MLLHPAIAESGFAALGAARSMASTAEELPAPTVVAPDLLQRFAKISDGRRDQGRIHPVAVVLALCAGAVVAGMSSFTAIAGWVADVPRELLAQLYCHRSEPAPGPPSKATIWRVVTGADSAAVDAVVGAWLVEQAAARDNAARDNATWENTGDEPDAALVPIAVDGKTVRGATDPDGNQVHLLAAATHQDALVVGQVKVGAKTNEIPMFAPLLDTLADAGVDLAHTVITADALHAQRAHAEYLHSRGAGFVFTVKHNQPRLFAALDALPWAQAPIAHRDVDRDHGRITTRTIQVLPGPADLPFPHLNQAWLIERYITDPAGTPISAVAALGVTNLTATRATPQLLATVVRGHWGIESLHWLRDTVYHEDDSTAHTQSGPQNMAALRNLAIGAHRLTGRRDITEATRSAARFMDRPFKILKLIPT
ncbi:MAG: ISAs1 family transposase [Pseudonocardiaceae bacterium]